MRRSWAVPLLASLLMTVGALFGSCGGSSSPGKGTLSVAGSNPIVTDWLNVVGEGVVTARTIVPAGADLHTFQPSPSEVRAIAEADAVFVIGAGLEGSLEDTIRANAGGPVITLSDGLSLSTPPGEGSAAPGSGIDPHIWMDIEMAIGSIERIRDELSALDQAHADTFSANAAAYTTTLRALDGEIAAMLAPLPPGRKLLVTFHDAFGRFAARYGLTIIGFVVENPEEEPSAAQIADLITEMKASGANRIYVEPQFSARVVTQVASETGADIRTIPSDTLNDSYPTYIDLMRAIAKGISQ